MDRVIYVVPEVYGGMKLSDRYTVARAVGKLAHLKDKGEKPTILLIGPGRWATADPFLGVPVSFSEIDTVSMRLWPCTRAGAGSSLGTLLQRPGGAHALLRGVSRKGGVLNAEFLASPRTS